jgi:hypothetical protein
MRRRVVGLAVVIMATVACGGDGGGQSPVTTLGPAVSNPVADAAAFDRFGEATVVATSAQGERRWSVWLADNEQRRQRGLMEVTDPTLAGRVGMAFWFSSSTTGGFWMRNTRLPLTILFVDDDGVVVS